MVRPPGSPRGDGRRPRRSLIGRTALSFDPRLPLVALCDLLLPPLCRVCGARRAVTAATRSPGLRWCDAAAVCGDCRPRFAPRPLARPGEPPLYGGRPTDAALAGLVATWKYRGARGATDVLGDLVVAALRLAAAEHGAPAALVPIPLHRARRRERGFNQAELLARAAGGTPVWTDVLRRTRATPQQAKLAGDAADRAVNVAGCFAAAQPGGAPPRVVLVDDIITSGATVREAAAALAAAGWLPLCAVAAGLSGGRGDAAATPP